MSVEGLKLHLGSAGTVVPGWENLDKSPSVRLARVPRLRRGLRRVGLLTDQQAAGFPPGVKHADVSRRLPYPDGSAAYVYSSHLIEHLSRWQALEFVRECRRVLAPGGVMRTATPDLAEMIRRYQEGAPGGGATPADRLLGEMAMFQQPRASLMRRLIARNLSAAHHQWLYDRESLTALLIEGGMSEPRTLEYRQGGVPDLELLEHRPESIFVEATRP